MPLSEVSDVVRPRLSGVPVLGARAFGCLGDLLIGCLAAGPLLDGRSPSEDVSNHPAKGPWIGEVGVMRRIKAPVLTGLLRLSEQMLSEAQQVDDATKHAAYWAEGNGEPGASAPMRAPESGVPSRTNVGI